MFCRNHRTDRCARSRDSHSTRPKSRRARTNVGHFRYTLERLEDRTLLAVCSTTGTVPPGSTPLDYDGFHASGRGDVTTQGTIAGLSNELRVDDASTWCMGHGIRVQRAGKDDPLHNADSGWTGALGAPAGVVVTHDPVQKVEGVASVRTEFSGPDPGTAVNLSEVDLHMPADFQSFDELRFWIRSSTAIASGDLEIRTFDASRSPRFAMVVPPLVANAWSEVFLRIEHRVDYDDLAGPPQFLALRCIRNCVNLDIHMDDFWLVRDLMGAVVDIHSLPDGKAVFDLDRPIEADRPTPNLPIYPVFHDDTLAAKRWLDTAASSGANLFAPAGVYYINQQQLPAIGGEKSGETSKSLPLYNDTHLLGAGTDLTTFKNTGGAWNGPSQMFRSPFGGAHDIKIEHIGFDWNGWNAFEFATLISIKKETEAHASNIRILENRFFDSNFPGMERCHSDEDCETRQRHHVLVQTVDGVWVENNQMSGGGRIKTGGGGLGVNMHIRNNALDFVNDNGITIVDSVPGVTEHVEITDNTIINAVSSGIFFGADGEGFLGVPGMVLRDVMIARNRVSGPLTAVGIVGDLPLTAEAIRVIDNVIQVEGEMIVGIFLARDRNAPSAATQIRVEGNAIVASATGAMVSLGGMVLHGPMRDVRVASNTIRCDGCRFIQEAGIWFRLGAFDSVEVDHNEVVGAYEALHLGTNRETPLGVAITNAHIHDNDFLNSSGLAPQYAQVSMNANPGEVVQARIVRNRIERGAGHGIATKGDGHFDLNVSKNVIARNDGDGVSLQGGTEILVSRNAIFNNLGLGIDLFGGEEDSFGVTANDSADSDPGPNQLQNFPRIISAVRDRSRTRVLGTISTNPTSNVTIEFFVNPTCDESGYGEGQIFVGRTLVRDVVPSDPPDGDREFTANLGRLPVGWFLTATATDGINNTSEFSGCVLIDAIDRVGPAAAAFFTGVPANNRFPAAPAGTGYRAHTRAVVPPFVSREWALMSGAPQLLWAKTSRATSAALTSLAWLHLQAGAMGPDHQPGPRQQHTGDGISIIDSLLESRLALTDLPMPI